MCRSRRYYPAVQGIHLLGDVQVNAEALHARTFTTWRQNTLMGLHKVVKEKGGSFAHHIYNVNYNIDTDLGHMEGRLAEI